LEKTKRNRKISRSYRAGICLILSLFYCAEFGKLFIAKMLTLLLRVDKENLFPSHLTMKRILKKRVCVFLSFLFISFFFKEKFLVERKFFCLKQNLKSKTNKNIRRV
jgi:hypothetical protein